MSDRELYLWMTGALPEEQMDYKSLMSVMFGTLAHAINEAFLDWMGVSVPLPPGDCPACGRPRRRLRARPSSRYCTEHGAVDEKTRARCHLDAILEFGGGKLAWDMDLSAAHGYDFKCLAPETLVSMSDGSLLPAAKISEGDSILGWDETAGRLVPRRVSHAWDNGIAPVVKVRTRGGRELTVTEDHPFLTKRGWVKARDLVSFGTEWKHGRNRPIDHDAIRTAWGHSWWGGEEGDADQAALLGLLVGDGGLTCGRVNLTNNDPGVFEFVSSYVARFGCKLTRTGSRKAETYHISAGLGANRNHFLDLLRKEGLLGKGARAKFVPPSVWAGGPMSWAAFLSGYLDADGSVFSYTYPLVKWTSVNRELLLECQVLLSYLGIKSSVNVQRGTYKGAEHISWVLWVRDARSVARAQQVLRPHHSRKSRALDALSPVVRTDGRFVRDNLEWDAVTDVIPLLARPTISIEVEGHTHVTGGLITHNTIYPMGLSKVRDMDLGEFRERWPHYWAQMQECMRIRGLRRYIVFFVTLGNPWETREFHIPFDPEFAAETEAKYLAVLSHVERKVPIVA
jgi:hypothetical protein